MSKGDMVCAVCKGTAYTLWGRTSCASGDTVVYTGLAGHFASNGGSANGGGTAAGTFCIDNASAAAAGVQFTDWGDQDLIMRGAGAGTGGWMQFQDAANLPCVVCR
jgi:hypothetical protein